MSDFKKTYRLIQQTPMIHFQYDQSGATLRATEVKPKLDKFIIKKIGNGDYENGKEVLFDLLKTDEYRDWLIGYKYNPEHPDKKPEHYALNYKMQIVANGNPKISTSTEDAIKKKKENKLYNKYKNEYKYKSEYKDANGNLDKKKVFDNICKVHKKEYGLIIDEYKKGINEKNKNSTESVKINDMYFGNMISDNKSERENEQGEKDKNVNRKMTTEEYEEAVKSSYKETVFYYPDKCDICLTVICFIPELLKVIDDNIAEFFAVHNFGTRQSKGFGGFSLQKEDGTEPYSEDKIVELLTDKYKFFYVEADKKEDPFSLANFIYTTMKSGIDRPDKYTKINGYLLERYNKDIGTDKDMMKEKLLPLKGEKAKYKKYLFVRALLGLTGAYEFKGKRRGKINVVGKEKDENGKPLIQRFPSPVTIKIVGKTILFIFNENLLKEIMGKWFIFTVAELNTPEKPQKYKVLKGDDELPIQVPQKFDVNKFIEDFVNYYNEKSKYYKNGLEKSRKAGGK